MTNNNETMGGISVMLAVTIVMFYVGFYCGQCNLKEVAIEEGYAEYNQTTGDWQWKKFGDKLDD